MAMEHQETREFDLQGIAERINGIVTPYISSPITITYVKMTDDELAKFSDWDRQRFGLLRSDEYFIVRRFDEVLYAVIITGDSLFTAMNELTDLIARKF